MWRVFIGMRRGGIDLRPRQNYDGCMGIFGRCCKRAESGGGQLGAVPPEITPVRMRALAVGAQALGALAAGSLAIGAVAVGVVVIGRLVIRRTRIRRLEIDQLVVRDLRVTDSLRVPGEERKES